MSYDLDFNGLKRLSRDVGCRYMHRIILKMDEKFDEYTPSKIMSEYLISLYTATPEFIEKEFFGNKRNAARFFIENQDSTEFRIECLVEYEGDKDILKIDTSTDEGKAAVAIRLMCYVATEFILFFSTPEIDDFLKKVMKKNSLSKRGGI